MSMFLQFESMDVAGVRAWRQTWPKPALGCLGMFPLQRGVAADGAHVGGSVRL